MGHQDVRLDVPGHLEPPCPRHPAPTVVIRGPVAIGGIAQPAIPLARTESAAPGTAQPSGISRTSTRTCRVLRSAAVGRIAAALDDRRAPMGRQVLQHHVQSMP